MLAKCTVQAMKNNPHGLKHHCMSSLHIKGLLSQSVKRS